MSTGQINKYLCTSMKRLPIKTDDGSYSLHLPEWNESYHSKHGAVQEAYHVFIRNGLDLFDDCSSIRLLEMGFGTGLNCMITFLESLRRDLLVDYTGVEAYPVESSVISKLDHVKALNANLHAKVMETMHGSSWEKFVDIHDGFRLYKTNQRFEDLQLDDKFHLIYFDAFGARVQPELWTAEIFAKMFDFTLPGGVLVTYAAKGSVRRAMLEVGYEVEKLPGPPGKREMLRARRRE